MKLQPDEIDDIARLLPVHGPSYVARWIGCDRSTVVRHGKLLGVQDWARPRGRRLAEIAARDVPGEAKVCLGCDELKPLTDYYRQKHSRMGRKARCKACEREARP